MIDPSYVKIRDEIRIPRKNRKENEKKKKRQKEIEKKVEKSRFISYHVYVESRELCMWKLKFPFA